MKRSLLSLLTVILLLSCSFNSFARHYFYGPQIILQAPIIPLGPPVYYYPPPPPVVYVEPSPPPPVYYVDRSPNYVYYCPSLSGYYPQVPRCPDKWLKVVPDGAPPR